MAFLNSMLQRFNCLISALESLGNDDKIFTIEFVKGRCEQEEQSHSQRDKFALSKSEAADIVVNLSSL